MSILLQYSRSSDLFDRSVAVKSLTYLEDRHLRKLPSFYDIRGKL